jgi:hypothetical protein
VCRSEQISTFVSLMISSATKLGRLIQFHSALGESFGRAENSQIHRYRSREEDVKRQQSGQRKKRRPRKKNEDVALDARSGRIAYTVLSFAGFLGMADRYFAIPWNAIHFD